MAERDHWSISEVLSELDGEFDDITISKIRFLESRGLLSPSRTPSGYRKFSRADLDQLRWILVQQRDNFLPLKVIKERIDAGAHLGGGVAAGGDELGPTPSEVTAPPPADSVATSPVGSLQEPPSPTPPTPALPASPTVPATPVGPRVDVDGGITRVEVARQLGVTVPQLQELERYDLIEAHRSGADTTYDDDGVAVATCAAAFLSQGFEARHLRPLVNAARAQADLLEQHLRPKLAQKDRSARRDAAAATGDLVDVGAALQAALVRRRLRRMLD